MILYLRLYYNINIIMMIKMMKLIGILSITIAPIVYFFSLIVSPLS